MKGGGFASLLAVLYGTAFLSGFNENLLNMSLVSIMADYSIDATAAQWLVSGYMIVATVIVTCMAYLYRKIPLKTLFFIASAFSFAGSLMGLCAMNFPFLMTARVVQAIGTGIFIPMMMNTILVVTPRNRLGTFMSIGSCMILFGPAFAPVVSGSLVTLLGWHSVFIIPTVTMALLAVLGAFFVRNLENHEAHLDVGSVALSAIALVTLSFGLMEITIDWTVAAASLAVFAITVVIFVIRQLRAENPLIDLSPVFRRGFKPCLMLSMLAMMTSFSLSVLLPLYFEGSLGMTSMLAGFVILVPVLANMGSALVSGRILDKRGEWPLLPLGFLISTTGLGIMAATAGGMSFAWVLVGAVGAYTGVGMVMSPSQSSGLRRLPPKENPHGVTLMSTFIQIAACIGPSMYTGIQSSTLEAVTQAGAGYVEGNALGFSMAILVAAVISGAGLAVSFIYALRIRSEKRELKAK